MLASVTAFPPAVLPRILNPIMFVSAARVVTHPAHPVYVRIVRMSTMILEVPALVVLMRMAAVFPWTLHRSRSGILAVHAIAMVVVFRKCWKTKSENACNCKRCDARGAARGAGGGGRGE